MSSLRRDFLGRMLCEHCWDGAHQMLKIKRKDGKKIAIRIDNCLNNGCECLCTAVRAEARERRRKANP